MREIVEKRSRCACVHDLGDGRTRVSVSKSPQNYYDGATWHKIDTTLVRQPDNTYIPTAVEIRLTIGPGPTYTYTAADGRTVTVTLQGAARVAPVAEGATLTFPNVFTDTDYIIEALPQGCATWLRLKSDASPKTWAWTVSGASELIGALVGTDANKAYCDLTTEVNDSVLTCAWSGFVAKPRDLRNGLGYTSAPTYPVIIDPTVNEAIGNTNDDRWCVNSTLQSDSVSLYAGNYNAGNLYSSGWRFQTVNVPQGATIDSATFSINVDTKVGTPDVTMYGYDTDDSAVWGTPIPSTVTRTTANAVPSWSAGSVQTIDVTSIVQEIVDRPGWAANNDMSLVLIGANVSGFNAYYMSDYSGAGQEGRLEIVYTGGGGGAVKLTVGRGLTNSVLLAPRSFVQRAIVALKTWIGMTNDSALREA